MFESIFHQLSSVRDEPLRVLVEVLLIGLIIWWFAAKLEGTRGTRPLRRLLLVLLVVTLAVRILTLQIDWTRLRILYNFFVAGIGITALIAFQPELRRAFIRVGDVRFARRHSPKARLIKALVAAAGSLSRNKHGALIVIERGVDLRGWAENGTLINSELSANLLTTIFFPNTPLHDLGTIVRENRILAANCQLPTVESDEHDASLGSRHLAAVGMSYESDALVLVVSEETGTISLADNGRLTRYLSLDELEHELESRLTGPQFAARQRPSHEEHPVKRVVSGASIPTGCSPDRHYLVSRGPGQSRGNRCADRVAAATATQSCCRDSRATTSALQSDVARSEPQAGSLAGQSRAARCAGGLATRACVGFSR